MISHRLKLTRILAQTLCFFIALERNIEANPPTQLDILAQDDLTLGGGTIRLHVHHPVNYGPSDQYSFVAQPQLRVGKDRNGNFLEYLQQSHMPRLKGTPPKYNINYNYFDTVHTFGVVSLAASLHKQDMRMLYDVNYTSPPLALYPHDENGCNNAYFTPEGNGSLHFFEIRTQVIDQQSQEVSCTEESLGQTCRSFDIPIHEYGHGELHRHRPAFISSWRPETGALHEAYGDLKVIFTGLSLEPLRKNVLASTKGDLFNSSFLPDIGESFGYLLGQGYHGIRSVNNNLTLADIDCEVHSLSRVFSGAVYDVLAHSFEARRNSWWSVFGLEYDDNTLLNLVSTDLRQLTLAAFDNVPSDHPTFSQVGKTMDELASNNPKWNYLAHNIEQSFAERGININSPTNGFTQCDREVLSRASTGNDLGAIHCGTIDKLWSLKTRQKTARNSLYFGGRR